MNFEYAEKISNAIEEAKNIIYGQDELLESILSALVCEGHLLIEGMPGLGKTLSVSTVSKLCNLNFKRIQFTPDLLPSDLIGTMVYVQHKEEFTTKFGPLFTQLLLADEINRSPAKVQAALLESMAEKQVTIGDNTHKLESPFVVLATQNPIDQEGTYSLPEAQMDRFMMKVLVDYPDFDAEMKVLDLKISNLENIQPILSKDMLCSAKEEVQKIYCDEKIKKMIVKIVQSTRPGSKFFLKKFEGKIMAGASPRAAIWLYNLSKFYAYLEKKDFVSPEHLLKIIPSIMGHRIILTYEAMVDNISARDIVLKMAKAVL